MSIYFFSFLPFQAPNFFQLRLIIFNFLKSVMLSTNLNFYFLHLIFWSVINFAIIVVLESHHNI